MKRIVLFRFHKNPLVCKNRLELIKKFNPSIKIFGLFGGVDVKRFKKLEETYLEDIYVVKNKMRWWKWLNGDLSTRDWYKKVGKKADFDMLYMIEWDLIIFGSLESIYKNIPKNGIGLTALTPLKKVEKRWDWTTNEPYKTHWYTLLRFVKQKYNYNKKPYASLGPGTCLPREFLEKYCNIEIPQLCHDELRIPLFSQIFGFKLYNTGFYKSWFSKEEEKFFNCNNKDINLLTIRKELAKPNGRRVFHPFRKIINPNLLTNQQQPAQ